MISVKCGHCRGYGRLELTGEYRAAYAALLAAGECHAAALAVGLGCKPTAANNRLAALESHGLATSRRHGRRRLFTAVPQAERGEPRAAGDFGGKLADILSHILQRPAGSPYLLNHEDGERYVRWGQIETDIRAAHDDAVAALRRHPEV